MSSTAVPRRPGEEDWAAAVAALRGLPAGARVLLAVTSTPTATPWAACSASRSACGRLRASRGCRRPSRGRPSCRSRSGAARARPAGAGGRGADPIADCSLFDVASIERLGELVDRLETAAPVGIVLDHHASNTGFGAINLVDPTAAATSVVADGCSAVSACRWTRRSPSASMWPWPPTPARSSSARPRPRCTNSPPGASPPASPSATSRAGCSTPGPSARSGSSGGAGPGPARRRPPTGSASSWTYATLDDLARFEQPGRRLEALIDSVRCIAEADVACVVKQLGTGRVGGLDAQQGRGRRQRGRGGARRRAGTSSRPASPGAARRPGHRPDQCGVGRRVDRRSARTPRVSVFPHTGEPAGESDDGAADEITVDVSRTWDRPVVTVPVLPALPGRWAAPVVLRPGQPLDVGHRRRADLARPRQSGAARPAPRRLAGALVWWLLPVGLFGVLEGVTFVMAVGD